MRSFPHAPATMQRWCAANYLAMSPDAAAVASIPQHRNSRSQRMLRRRQQRTKGPLLKHRLFVRRLHHPLKVVQEVHLISNNDRTACSTQRSVAAGTIESTPPATGLRYDGAPRRSPCRRVSRRATPAVRGRVPCPGTRTGPSLSTAGTAQIAVRSKDGAPPTALRRCTTPTTGCEAR